jgi:indolepyruvate ferredoxin oxidoreductase, alpha subunit
MLEPSSVAEAKEMIRHAFALSETLREPVIAAHHHTHQSLQRLCQPGGPCPNQTAAASKKIPMRCVVVPAVSRRLHVKLLANLAKAARISDQLPNSIG